MSAGVQTTVPLALGLLLDGAAPAANAGVSTTFPLVLGMLLEAGGSGAATISAAYGTPLSGTTATVGCTTDTASGTLYLVATTSATQPSIAQIKAGQDHTGAAAPWGGSVAVSSTSPSTTATGLTAATTYYTHAVQTVSAVDSNVDTSDSSWVTDNTGSGGGGIPTSFNIGSATLALAGDLGLSGSATYAQVYDIGLSTLALSGALGLSGDIGFVSGLRGSPPGLNFDADADEEDDMEAMQVMMAIAAAAVEMELV